MPSTPTVKSALVLDLGERVEMSFQWIPSGSFRTGSRGFYHDEEPRHLVQHTQPFYLGTFPVTQQQFAKWKPEHENRFADNLVHPAENMNWHEATEFCSWLNANLENRLPAGYVAGLPTEAQWEYACRAGTDTEYHTGDGEAALSEAGWYLGNSNSQTQSVGQKAANDFGLYDMHGNVDEWCADAWDEHAYKKRVNGVCNPFIDSGNDANRVIRGGSWFGSAGDCRSACRSWWWPGIRFRIRGFRVCLFLGPCPSGKASQTERAEQASVGVATRDEAAKPREIAQRAIFLEGTITTRCVSKGPDNPTKKFQIPS